MSARPSTTFLEEPWPSLALPEWKDTYATLHMYTQVIGKVRLALAPRVNHWWGVTFFVDATGLTTSSIPYAGGLLEIPSIAGSRLERVAAEAGTNDGRASRARECAARRRSLPACRCNRATGLAASA